MVVLIVETKLGIKEILAYCKSEENAKIQLEKRFFLKLTGEEKRIGNELHCQIDNSFYTHAIIRGEN